MDLFHCTTKHAENGLDGAVVLDLVAQDQSRQHVVATFPTEAFSGDSTDRGGEIDMSNHSLAPADIAPSLSTNGSRRCVLANSIFNN